MITIAECIDRTPDAVWTLARQCGVTAAVGGQQAVCAEARQ
jgi:hypothetical protein